MSNDSSRPFTTVAQAFEILGLVRDRGGASVGAVAAEFNLPKSTTHNYVATLTEPGYLTNRDGEYNLTPSLRHCLDT